MGSPPSGATSSQSTTHFSQQPTQDDTDSTRPTKPSYADIAKKSLQTVPQTVTTEPTQPKTLNHHIDSEDRVSFSGGDIIVGCISPTSPINTCSNLHVLGWCEIAKDSTDSKDSTLAVPPSCQNIQQQNALEPSGTFRKLSATDSTDSSLAVPPSCQNIQQQNALEPSGTFQKLPTFQNILEPSLRAMANS